MAIDMSRRVLPPEFLELQAEMFEARDRYEEVRAKYRDEVYRLHQEEEVFIATLAEDAPFVYATVRTFAKEPRTDEESPDDA